MDKRIAQLIELARRTGDRLVVLPESGDPFVLMDLDQYQTLLQPGAGRSAQKNNRRQLREDLALWKRTKQELAGEQEEEAGAAALAPASPAEAENKYYFEPIEADSSQSEATS